MACCCGSGCANCSPGCGCIGDVLDVTMTLRNPGGCSGINGFPTAQFVTPNSATFQVFRQTSPTFVAPFPFNPANPCDITGGTNTCPQPQTCVSRFYGGCTTIQVYDLASGLYIPFPYCINFACCSYVDTVQTAWSFLNLANCLTPTFIAPYPGPLVITGTYYPPNIPFNVNCFYDVTVVDNHPPFPCP